MKLRCCRVRLFSRNARVIACLGMVAGMALAGVGCVSAEKDRVVRMHVGLTRAQAIEVMGTPARIEQNGDLEVLHFEYRNNFNRSGVPPISKYYAVIGTNGRVDAFGPDHGK